MGRCTSIESLSEVKHKDENSETPLRERTGSAAEPKEEESIENLKPENMTIALRQGDMASLIGISTAQLERVLKDLRLRGIIETSRGKIHVLDTDALQSMCSTELRKETLKPRNNQ